MPQQNGMETSSNFRPVLPVHFLVDWPGPQRILCGPPPLRMATDLLPSHSALARKMVATFRLSSEQLSSQDHYTREGAGELPVLVPTSSPVGLRGQGCVAEGSFSRPKPPKKADSMFAAWRSRDRFFSY